MKEVEVGLAKLDQLQPQIKKKYERYEKLAEERAQLQARRLDSPQTPLPKGDWRFHDRTTRRASIDVIETHSINAGDNKDLAVQLARNEIQRRSLARKATRLAGISEETEQERRTGGDWANWEEAFTNDEKNITMNTLSQQMQKVRAQVDGKSNGNETKPQPKSPAPRSIYNYPAIEPSHRGSIIHSPTVKPLEPFHTFNPRPPPPPPKDVDPSLSPIRPTKQPLVDGAAHINSPIDEISPAGYSFKPSAYLENGNPLRTVFLPPELRHKFLAIAATNTSKNLETCGILCGTLISNALFISRLVIPEQESTSDTCEMLNESALFDYVDGEDLMVLGWIHTHPTQTCFMSSRDVHTHCGYQVMMPESIAIVCAPSKTPDWGVFRLTDPPGMPAVLNCRQTGIFHPHSEPDIYTDALRPGHVFEAKGLEFEVHDMRVKP